MVQNKDGIKIKTYCIYVMLLLLQSCSTSKNDAVLFAPLSNKHKINALVKYFAISYYSDIYVVDRENTLTVYNSIGGMKVQHADKKLGDLTKVDVTNPLLTALYYGQHGIIKIMDDKLATVKQINTTENKSFQGNGVMAVSNDNGFWIYEAQNQKAIKVDQNLKAIAETNVLRDLGHADFVPYDMIEKNNHLILTDKNKGFLIFDNFGQYEFFIKGSDIKSFQFDGAKIICHTGKGAMMLTTSSPVEYDIELQKSESELASLKQIVLHSKRWYYSYFDGIDWEDK
jgi:hypothetical protein